MSFSISHYLDASAVVPLITKEAGTEQIESYIRTHCSFNFYITEFAFYEVLGVLKRKWKKEELDDHGYESAIFVLEAYIDEKLIEIDSDFKPHDRRLISELGDLVRKYQVDFSDALQIHAVLNGKWKSHVGPCQTVLVTADKDLIAAAISEGLRVWKFPDGAPPEGEEPNKCSTDNSGASPLRV
jgi:predicted nucleic acid-binding protein